MDDMWNVWSTKEHGKVPVLVHKLPYSSNAMTRALQSV